MMLGGETIGMLSAQSYQSDIYTQEDLQILSTLANQAASTLENARLFDETRQRLAELTALHGTGQRLLAARLSPEQIYAAVHHAVSETMPCEAFVIVLSDEERGDYEAVYFFDKGQRFPARRLPRGSGLSGQIFSTGETILIDDVAKVEVQATHFGSMESTRSILAVPLRRGDEVIGMLSTQSYKPHAFGESQRVLLETITAQLSSALENTKLYQQTRSPKKDL
jgi:GAF domain-containing protein